jgi:energy-coupling factor transport system permease protein
MSLAFYHPTGGFFERANPVSKLISLAVAFVPPFFGNNPVEVLPYFALLFFAALLARAGVNLLRVYKLMIILFVMSVVLWNFFYKGQTPLCAIGPLIIMKESLLYGITIGIRLNCFVLAAIIFLTSTPIEDFTYGLSKLGIPFVVSFALTLAFRLTPLFMETGQAIVMAQKARGLDLDSGGPLRRIRHYVPIIVPVLASGLRRADQLAMALESRGFGKDKKRSVVSEFPVTWRDYVLMSVTFLAGALMGLYRFI